MKFDGGPPNHRHLNDYDFDREFAVSLVLLIQFVHCDHVNIAAFRSQPALRRTCEPRHADLASRLAPTPVLTDLWPLPNWIYA